MCLARYTLHGLKSLTFQWEIVIVTLYSHNYFHSVLLLKLTLNEIKCIDIYYNFKPLRVITIHYAIGRIQIVLPNLLDSL